MAEITNEVLFEKLSNLEKNNNAGHLQLKEQNDTTILSLSKILEDHEHRIRRVEDWRLQFVAKFSVYASLAIFLGTLAAQIAIKLLFR